MPDTGDQTEGTSCASCMGRVGRVGRSHLRDSVTTNTTSRMHAISRDSLPVVIRCRDMLKCLEAVSGFLRAAAKLASAACGQVVIKLKYGMEPVDDVRSNDQENCVALWSR